MGVTRHTASLAVDLTARLPYGLVKTYRGWVMVSTSGGDLGFETTLSKAADKLRGNMEPSDYKHVALGLIFLKHISDSFEASHAELLAEYPAGAEDPDEYLANNIFWVPAEARWATLQANARQTDIGRRIDAAMMAIEADNASLKVVLP